MLLFAPWYLGHIQNRREIMGLGNLAKKALKPSGQLCYFTRSTDFHQNERARGAIPDFQQIPSGMVYEIAHYLHIPPDHLGVVRWNTQWSPSYCRNRLWKGPAGLLRE